MEATMDIEGSGGSCSGWGASQTSLESFHTCFVVEQALLLFGFGRVGS